MEIARKASHEQTRITSYNVCYTKLLRSEEMKAAIHNGIPITFAFYIDLFVSRSKWPDKKIREYEFHHIMEYDSLKKEYVIQRRENGDSKVRNNFV